MIAQPKVFEGERMGYNQEYLDKHFPLTASHPIDLLCPILRLDRLVPYPLLHLGLGWRDLYPSRDRRGPIGRRS